MIHNREFQELYQQHSSLIDSIAYSFNVLCRQYGIDKQDLVQIGTIVLWSAAKSFDTDGEWFQKYVARSAKREMYRYILEHTTGVPYTTVRRMRKPVSTYVSLDAIVEGCGGCDFIGTHEDDATMLYVTEFIQTLPHSYVAVLRDLMNGHTIESVCEMRNMSRKTARYIMAQVKRRYLEHALMEAGGVAA